jgi:hypothetical protein
LHLLFLPTIIVELYLNCFPPTIIVELKDDKVYTITYVEEDDYENDLQIAQRIIESFGVIR